MNYYEPEQRETEDDLHQTVNNEYEYLSESDYQRKIIKDYLNQVNEISLDELKAAAHRLLEIASDRMNRKEYLQAMVKAYVNNKIDVPDHEMLGYITELMDLGFSEDRSKKIVGVARDMF